MKTIAKILAVTSILSLLFLLAACGQKTPEQLWDENAVYTENQTFGEVREDGRQVQPFLPFLQQNLK